MTTTPTTRYALNLLLDPDDRLLLLRRSPHSRLGANCWGLPAGKIEGGETAREAAAREMREEIGDGHAVVEERYVGPIRDTFYGGQFEIHLFQKRWSSGTVVLNDEHTEFAWVSAAEIADYDVMDGVEEDIALLGFWPQDALNQDKLPEYLRRRS